MSLVGSLEDLGLGDILQIISLSRKSGVLWIRSPAGEGQVLFRDGLIQGVFARGGPTDLRGLVATYSDLPKAEIEASVEEARRRVCGLGEVLAERGLLSQEAQDDLLRDHISSSVFTMFSWSTGEFSFEISARAEAPDEELFLAPGVNPQFLALEGTRLHDEMARTQDSDESVSEHPGLEAAFSDQTADPAGEEATGDQSPQLRPAPEAPLAEVELIDETEWLASDAGVADAVLVDASEIGSASHAQIRAGMEVEPHPAGGLVAAEAAVGIPAPAVLPAPRTERAPPPVVVIDPDLAVLEWLKRVLLVASGRVHIFQRPEQGISRIRQYLARAETPWVLLASDAPADPLSGARDAAEIVRRLKSQAPRMPVFLLECPGTTPRSTGPPDTTLAKPSARMLADPRCSAELAAVGDALVSALDRKVELIAAARPAPVASLPPDTLARLRELSARLRDPASQGEVLSLVMGFAAETFSRVAMFMVRDERVHGIAQVGLPRAGGPGDANISDIALPASESSLFRQVIESKSPVRGAPRDEGDQSLAVLLGNALPREAYVAPIESGDRVVALLYADNLPGDQPIGDSSALEVVLHEAGLALDRAVLERALAEAERG